MFCVVELNPLIEFRSVKSAHSIGGRGEGRDEGVLEGVEDEEVEATWRPAGVVKGGVDAQGADAAAKGGGGAVGAVAIKGSTFSSKK